MTKLLLSLVLTITSICACAEGIQCSRTVRDYNGNFDKSRISKNIDGLYDFTRDNELLATNLKCTFIDFSAHCYNNAHEAVDVNYTKEFSVNAGDQQSFSIMTYVKFYFQIQGTQEIIFYNPSNRSTKCELID